MQRQLDMTEWKLETEGNIVSRNFCYLERHNQLEPLSPVKLTEFSRVLLVPLERIFDMPKSPTRALISSARRMLLGLRSQWTTGG